MGILRVSAALALLAALAAAGSVDVTYNKAGTYRRLSFTTGPAQRCFTFRCLKDRVKWIEWEDMQKESIVFLYDQDWCNGNARGRIGTSGYFYSYEFGGTEPVRSLMLWESGSYATRGLEDVCYFDERGANTTLVGSEGSGSSGGGSNRGVVVVVGESG